MNQSDPGTELTRYSRRIGDDQVNLHSRAILRRPGIWVAAACLLAIVIYFAFASRSRNASANATVAATARQAVPVAATAAKLGDLDLYISAIGTVTSFNTVTVKTRVDGQIDKILFKEGQMVNTGDQLAEIDPRPFQVQLTQAEGQMARDRANLVNARTLYARDKVLYAKDVIARQDVDNQRAQVGQYEGTVENDQGIIDSAKLNLIYTKITAPISGRVGLRLVDLGNMVHATDPNGLLVITQLQPIAVIFSVPEDDLQRIMAAMRNTSQLPVDVYDHDFKVKLGAGFLLTTDNQIDQTTGTIKLKAQCANEDKTMFPNQFVNTKLLVDKTKNTVIVPAPAVQRSSQGTFVYVVQSNQTVAMRPVEIEATQGERAALDSGVKPGELVVTDGMDKLRQGSKVVVQLAGNPISADEIQ